MKFIVRKDLLIILISLFSFSSCRKEGDLGLEQQINEEGLLGIKVDTCTIVGFTIKDDTLISANYVRNQLGAFHDPTFGVTNASVAFHTLLPQNNVDFGDSLVLDSIVLVMGYITDQTQRFYGDSTSVMNLEVFQLDEDISNDSVYFSNKNFRLKSTAIGQRSYTPRPNDSIIIQNIRKGKADTVVKVYPQLRIRLNDTFGQELLSKSGQVDLSENAAYLQAYKGLYVKATRTSGDGGIMSFDLGNSNRSFMVLYYKQGIDTTNFVFNINSAAANVNKYEHDYTGTDVATQLADSNLGAQKVYIQSLGGVKAKLKFPTIDNLLDSGLIAINKAELIVKIENGTDVPYAPIQNMAFKAITTNGSTLLVSTGIYNSTTKQYTLEFTRALQQVIQGKLEIAYFILEDNSKQIRANRAVITGGESANPIQLRVFYTKLY